MAYDKVPASGEDGRRLVGQAVMTGLITTVFLVLVISALVALLVYLTGLTEGTAASVLYYAGLGCVAVGGSFGARRSGRLGWLHGGLVGFLYAVISIALSFLVMPGTLIVLDLFRQTTVVAVVGALGGIIGVNI